MSEAVNSVATEERKTIVTKKDLLRTWWKWALVIEVPVSFDRMQAFVLEYSTDKVSRKLYKDDLEKLQAAMRRCTSMFSTNCDWRSIIHGITISLEEQRALGHDDISPGVTQSLKLGLMGPLAGIGDSVDQGIVATIPLTISAPMTLEGSVIVVSIPGLIYIAWSFSWSWFLFNKRYSPGKNPILEILHSGAIKKVIDTASIVGLFVIGCLSASYIKVQAIVELANDTSAVRLQEIIDRILPNMLPFIVVMGIYLYITERGPKYIRLMIHTMTIAIVLTFFHII